MKTEIINKLDDELFILTYITVNRLFDIGSDACFLYLFYCKCAKLQKTKSIYATDSFCMKGIGWGKTRFYNAKKLLIENSLIQIKQTRDKDGKLNKTFIIINYFPLNNYNVDKSYRCPRFPDSGEWETNAYNININAYEEEISNDISSNASEEISRDISSGVLTNSFQEEAESVDNIPSVLREEEDTDDIHMILDVWNLSAKDIPDDSQHQSLDVLVTKIYMKGGRRHYISWTLYSFLKELLINTNEREVTEAIQNYHDIVLSQNHDYSYAFGSLGKFLLSYEGEGWKRFLNKNDPFEQFKRTKWKHTGDPFDKIKDEFNPITNDFSYTKANPVGENTYFGFNIEQLKSPESRFADVDMCEEGLTEWRYGAFYSLEIIIASLLFNRRSNPQLDKLKHYFKVWSKRLIDFRKE